MTWNTPKTDWATSDIVPASELNEIGQDLDHLMSNRVLYVHLANEADPAGKTQGAADATMGAARLKCSMLDMANLNAAYLYHYAYANGNDGNNTFVITLYNDTSDTDIIVSTIPSDTDTWTHRESSDISAKLQSYTSDVDLLLKFRSSTTDQAVFKSAALVLGW